MKLKFAYLLNFGWRNQNVSVFELFVKAEMDDVKEN